METLLEDRLMAETVGFDGEQDQPRHLMDVVAQIVTVLAVTGGALGAFLAAWWWAMVGLAVVCMAVALAPVGSPKHGRTVIDAVAQGVALAAIPLGIAAAFEWGWWWAVIAAAVLICAAIVANYAAKPKADDHG